MCVITDAAAWYPFEGDNDGIEVPESLKEHNTTETTFHQRHWNGVMNNPRQPIQPSPTLSSGGNIFLKIII